MESNDDDEEIDYEELRKGQEAWKAKLRAAKKEIREKKKRGENGPLPNTMTSFINTEEGTEVNEDELLEQL